MGEHTISNIAGASHKETIHKAIALKKVRKKFTNHNARKTKVSKLKKTNKVISPKSQATETELSLKGLAGLFEAGLR